MFANSTKGLYLKTDTPPMCACFRIERGSACTFLRTSLRSRVHAPSNEAIGERGVHRTLQWGLLLAEKGIKGSAERGGKQMLNEPWCLYV